MNNNLVWINVCEASADNYGAMLMQELKKRSPGVEITGMGGPAMRALGLQPVFRSEDLSLMGLTEVVTSLPRIMGYLRHIKKRMQEKPPGIVVLLDAPDFNFRLARMAHSLDIPVLYFIPPQVWAWRKSRVRFLKKYVDRIACIFPFEPAFFRKNGIKADFVGHPAMEKLTLPALEKISFRQNQIALLPGSRKKEISSLLPLFSKSANILRQTHPDLTVNVVQAPGVSMEFLRRFCPQDPWFRFVSSEDRHACIKECSMALAASGTVTLECAILEVPAIVAYKLSWLSYQLGSMLIHVKYISMPNLILGRQIFPELIQDQANVDKLVSTARVWLENPDQTVRIRKDLKKIKTLLGYKSAGRACAELTLELMQKATSHEIN
ncbi:MAG: lipid-A-disaccharide synthase [Desulfotignum sp.]|nr:lipid-A-disaccharide synthase [Desulfobacteraceae bacterium]